MSPELVHRGFYIANLQATANKKMPNWKNIQIAMPLFASLRQSLINQGNLSDLSEMVFLLEFRVLIGYFPTYQD